MGTSNFYYKNRCIVVTDEDYECGNYPELGDVCHNTPRSFPSSFLQNCDFEFWDIIMTSGYYECACIDYIPKLGVYADSVVESRMKYSWQYNNVRELIDDFVDEFKVTKYRVRKIIGKVNECENLEAFVDRAIERMQEYLSSQEEVKVNELLDQIRDEYGYEEYSMVARFSNGEAIYHKVK
jgi:hypothetical protein